MRYFRPSFLLLNGILDADVANIIYLTLVRGGEGGGHGVLLRRVVVPRGVRRQRARRLHAPVVRQERAGARVPAVPRVLGAAGGRGRLSS